MKIWSIVRQAFDTAKTQRQLWLFGVFFASGGGVSLNGPADSSPEWLGAALIALGVVGLAALLMHLVSEGALIHAAAHTRDGGKTSLRVGFREGMRTAPRVAAVKLLTMLVSMVVALLACAPLLIASALHARLLPAGLLTAFLGLLCLPVLLTVQLVRYYALRAVVLEDQGVGPALATGRGFLAGRIKTSLWLLVAQSLGASAFSAFGLFLALPVLALGAALYFSVGMVPALVVGGLLMLPIAVCVSGAGGTYSSSLWTHLYLAERTERA